METSACIWTEPGSSEYLIQTMLQENIIHIIQGFIIHIILLSCCFLLILDLPVHIKTNSMLEIRPSFLL